MDIVKLINYMENLRYERKLSQEEYLYNIISQRQYYRYRYGESEAPFEVVSKLAERLQIPLLKIITQYSDDSEKGKKLVQQYFNLVISKKSAEAESIFLKINDNNMIDEDSRTLAKLGKILSDYNRRYFSKIELCALLKENMHFKEIMQRNSLHDFELYLLGLLMEYSQPDRDIILEKLIYLFDNKKVLLGGNILYITQAYFWIIKNLGRTNRFKEVILFAQNAIDYCRDEFSYYCLEYFHYYKSLAHQNLEEIECFRDELYNAITICMYYLPEKREKFFSQIQIDLEINPREFYQQFNHRINEKLNC
ncbi:MAG: hypothetical protein KKE16_07165 [Firmicutes bacterium]|nr:hypothetical protein [Bacillota bacterium]